MALPTYCYLLLPTTNYLLPATCHLLPATCHLLPTTYYVLPNTLHLPIPTNNNQHYCHHYCHFCHHFHCHCHNHNHNHFHCYNCYLTRSSHERFECISKALLPASCCSAAAAQSPRCGQRCCRGRLAAVNVHTPAAVAVQLSTFVDLRTVLRHHNCVICSLVAEYCETTWLRVNNGCAVMCISPTVNSTVTLPNHSFKAPRKHSFASGT